MSKIKVNVLIGRFQPVTNAHREIILRTLESCDQLIIVVGSSFQPRTYKNPWSFDERKAMLNNIINEVSDIDYFKRIDIVPVRDSLYNDTQWAANIQKSVGAIAMSDDICLVGHKKGGDNSTYYLDMFPQWKFNDIGKVEPLNATDVRELYFKENANLNFLFSVVPGPVFRLLSGWFKTQEYNQVIRERVFVEKYKQAYDSLPYPPTFVTVDSCIVQNGHILLIQRRSEPGKGLWALPGGYLNANTDRTLQDAMIRELREETKIKVPAPVLIGSIKNTKVFDALGRSPRGRIITNVFYIELTGTELPKVKGDDDAVQAKWVPLASIKTEEMFEDHAEIISVMTGLQF